MAVTVWAPLGVGIPASIWSPGGSEADDGGGGETCDLAAYTDTPPEASAGLKLNLVDTFTGTDGAPLVGHAPETAFGNWFLGTGVLSLLDSSAVNNTTVIGTALNIVAHVNNTVSIGFTARVGFFSELDSTATISFTCTLGDVSNVTLHFASVDNVRTAYATWTYNGTTITTAVAPIPFCTWTSVFFFIEDTEYYFSTDAAVEFSDEGTTTGVDWVLFQEVNVSLSITNAAAGGLRFASAYMYSFPGL